MGEVETRAEKYLIVQASSVAFIFPLRVWDVLKGPKGEIKVNQQQHEQAVFLLGDTALLFLACLIVLNIFHLKCMGTGGNDV